MYYRQTGSFVDRTPQKSAYRQVRGWPGLAPTILLFHVANRHCPVLCSPSASNARADGCNREERPNGCNTQRIYLRRGVPWQDAAGWGGGPANTISVDDSVAHSGKNSVRMVRDGESAGSFSTISKKIPLTYSGESLEFVDSFAQKPCRALLVSGCVRIRTARPLPWTTCRPAS